MRRQAILLIISVMLFTCSIASADEIRIAVASNFAHTLKTLATQFESQSRHKVTLQTGSTGNLFVQIKRGDDFDLFFAADTYRPAILEEEGYALPASRFTYAIGRIALWSIELNVADKGLETLRTVAFNHIAIPDTKRSPYGRSTKEILISHNLWNSSLGRLVTGDDVEQTYQLIRGGSAELGFIALSQLQQPDRPLIGSYWIVPETMHRTIHQQAVVFNKSPAISAFVEFIQREESKAIIRSYGYKTP